MIRTRETQFRSFIFNSVLNVVDVYRSASGSDNFHFSSILGLKARQVPAQTVSLGPVEVAVPGTYDESPTIQTIGQPVTSISSDGATDEKPAGLGPDYDLERGAAS
jgi:hypothetical protein